MKRISVWLAFFLLAVALCGCQIRTVDEMYVPPKRSEDFNSLQQVISQAMNGLEYSAPVSGDNRQTVQTADLNGDGVEEALLFAQSSSERPLQILIFSQKNGEYVHTQTIDMVGATFDRVEYAQMDGNAGVELIVGTQVSDQISRSVSVFTFSGGEAQQLVTADYLNYQVVDLDANGRSELFVLRAGATETDRGIVELYSVKGGVLERSVEVKLSETADKLKRIMTGQLEGGRPAIYVASAVDEDTLITDVYALVDGVFTNVSLSNDSGTSVKTMRNYFIYADDMDSDGVMELPALVEMRSVDAAWRQSDQNLIRWYSMTVDGEEVDKLYTYHNFLGGWYFQIRDDLAQILTVVDLGNVCDFYVWQEDTPIRVLSVHSLTGQSREEQSTADDRFVLYKGETVIFSAKLDDGAALFDITQESVLRSFYMIREHWKTGET